MHPSNKITKENLKDVIYWHRPNEQQVLRMEKLAQNCEALMECILELCPECADRTKALQYVRAARMWGNSSIALETPEIDHERGRKTIYLNAKPIETYNQVLSYDDLVSLACGDNPDIAKHPYTITYRGAFGPKTEGILSQGEKIVIKEKMKIDVGYTGCA